MTTSTEAPPLTAEELKVIRAVQNDIVFEQPSYPEKNCILDMAEKILRLLDEHEAANARIQALESAAEWKPTHRLKDEPRRFIESAHIGVNADGWHIMAAKEGALFMVPPDIFEKHFEALPELEGEKAPCHPK